MDESPEREIIQGQVYVLPKSYRIISNYINIIYKPYKSPEVTLKGFSNDLSNCLNIIQKLTKKEPLDKKEKKIITDTGFYSHFYNTLYTRFNHSKDIKQYMDKQFNELESEQTMSNSINKITELRNKTTNKETNKETNKTTNKRLNRAIYSIRISLSMISPENTKDYLDKLKNDITLVKNDIEDTIELLDTIRDGFIEANKTTGGSRKTRKSSRKTKKPSRKTRSARRK